MSDKYTDIQQKIYFKHKIFGLNPTDKAINEILEKVSKMIADAIKMADEYDDNTK